VDVGADDCQNEARVAEAIKAVEFEAEVRQIKSMADHSFNLTLNIPEYCLPQAQEMMGWLLDQVKVAIIRTV
jgi:hypothetical protein